MPDIVDVSTVESRFNVGNTRAQALVNAAESHIEDIINTNVFISTETEEFEGGVRDFILDKAPIIDGTVTITDQKDDTNPDSPKYRIHNQQGIIENESKWDKRDFDELWSVEYDAGYAENESEVPGTIKEAAFIIIEIMNGQDNQKKSETIGNYEYVKKDDNFSDAKIFLNEFMRPNI